MKNDTEVACDQVMANMTLVEKETPARTSEKRMPSVVDGSSSFTDESTRAKIITWDSENDPANPRKFSSSKKLRLLLILSMISFIVPLSTSMFSPLIQQVLHEFSVTEEKIGAFATSIFILGFAISPLIYGPLSESWGRLPPLHVGNVLYCIFTLSCGFSNSMGTLIALRFVAGLVGSGCLSIGAGCIHDLYEPTERGAAISFWVAGPLAAPAIGPVIGGLLGSRGLSWRWVFWVLTIISVAATGLCFLTFRETNPSIILGAKTRRLRAERQDPTLESALALNFSQRELWKRTLSRPFKVMVQSPIVDLLSLLNGLSYSLLFVLFTTFPFVFQQQYGFQPVFVGLMYLGIGIASFIPLIFVGKYSDRIYSHLCKKTGSDRPENRLYTLIYGLFFIPVGSVIYGWAAQYRVIWIVPVVGTGTMAIGIVMVWLSVQAYIIDAFGIYAASAIATNTFIRSVMGAFIPLAGPPLYAAIGLGWGNTLLGFIAMVMIPIPYLFYKYGEKLREKYPIRL